MFLLQSPWTAVEDFLTIKLLANPVLLVLNKTLRQFGINEIEAAPRGSCFNHWNV